MAEAVKISMPSTLRRSANGSAWAPLREPLFRSLWVAAVISYTGTWMQNVGAGWLMTQLTMSPLMVGLVQAATTLPVPAERLPHQSRRRSTVLQLISQPDEHLIGNPG